MKKKYEKPILEKQMFSIDDVTTTSGNDAPDIPSDGSTDGGTDGWE